MIRGRDASGSPEHIRSIDGTLLVNSSHPSPVSGALADGTPVVVSVSGWAPPLTVWVSPAAGDTVKVEYRVNAAAPWVEITDMSPATSYKDIALDGPVSDLRFTRTAGTGTTSAYGVA